MSTAKSASRTSTSAGMLSFCVSVRWSNSGAALRSSSGTSSSEATCVSLGVGTTGVVSSGAMAGIETVSSGVVVGSVVDGTSAGCVGSGCGFCVGGVGGGVVVGLVFVGVGALVFFVGVAVTVLVTVVSGAESVSSGVGSPKVVVTVTVVSGVMSQTSPTSHGSTGSKAVTEALALCTMNGVAPAPVSASARTTADRAVARVRATGALRAVPEPWSKGILAG